MTSAPTTNEPAGIDLDMDKLEALARAVDDLPETTQPFVSMGGQVVIHTFSMSPEQVRAVANLYDAATPAMIITLIARARRAPAPVGADKVQQEEDWLDAFDYPKAALRREDWDPVTRKPKASALAQQSPAPVVAHDVPEARASQPEGATGTTGASVKTWQERVGPDYNDSAEPTAHEIAMEAEIADLRVQLAAKGQGEPVAFCVPDKNGKPLFGKGWMFSPIEIEQSTLPLYLAAPASAQPAEDPVVEANRQLLLDRSRVGIKKYGVTLANAGLSRSEIAQHALEEALDLANYLQTLIQTDASAQPDRGAAQAPDVQALNTNAVDVHKSSNVEHNASPESQPVAPETALPKPWQERVNLHQFPNDRRTLMALNYADQEIAELRAALAAVPQGQSMIWEPSGPLDANELEKMAKIHPDKCFLKGSGVLKLIGAIRTLEQSAAPTTVPDHSEREAANAGYECLKDVVSHHGDFHMACTVTRDLHLRNGDRDSAGYWDKQRHVLARMKVQAESALSQSPATIAAGQEAANAKDAAHVTYTCKGKGGVYSLIGVAYGAGTSRDTTVNLYREVGTGVMYFRTPADFHDRMERINAAMAAVGEAGQEGGDK